MKGERHIPGGLPKRLVARGTGRWARPASILLWAGFLVAIVLNPAFAHRLTTGSVAGISIPSLSHGQMAVIANNRAAILDLSDQQIFPDETFQRLRIYIGLQYFACVWGLMPGSVADEASPFNECSHAYLSATLALLLHMKTMRGNAVAVRDLIDKVKLDMLASNASLVECRFSGETFNTDDVVGPRWSEIPFHLPSLLSLLGAAIALVLGFGALGRFLRRSSRPQPGAAATNAAGC